MRTILVPMAGMLALASAMGAVYVSAQGRAEPPAEAVRGSGTELTEGENKGREVASGKDRASRQGSLKEVPANQIPANEIPTGKKTADEKTADEKPADEKPAHGKSAKDLPRKDVPGKGSGKEPAKGTAAKGLPGITPEREAAVMTFVRRHHSALTELLIHLKENSPRDYERAVRDLFRTSERLAQVQERDPLAYELELKLWQARSRAQLLAARLQMGDSEELRMQLRGALNEEIDLRLELLQRDHDRVSERARHLAEQMEKLRGNRSEEVDRQVRNLTASARNSDPKGKGPGKSPSKKARGAGGGNAPGGTRTTE